MRQRELRNSVSFCPRFGSLIIPIDPFKSKYVPSERISNESEGNIRVMVFLAGDLRPGRYAPCTSPPLTCYANHANSLVCTTVIKRKRCAEIPYCSKATVITVLCRTGHSGVGYNLSMCLFFEKYYSEYSVSGRLSVVALFYSCIV